MPELPDVEGCRRVLAAHAVGRPIDRVDVRDAGVLREAGPAGDGAAVLHFGLTWAVPGQERHQHDRVVFGFPDGESRCRDARKLRALWLESDRADVARAPADLVPDPGTPGAHLRTAAIGRLHTAMTTVLRQSIKDGRVPPRPSWLTGRPAPVHAATPPCLIDASIDAVTGRTRSRITRSDTGRYCRIHVALTRRTAGVELIGRRCRGR